MDMNSLNGIYLVIDPKREWSTLLQQLKSALEGGLNIVQVWNHWKEHLTIQEKADFLKEVKALCTEYKVPVLMHEDWKLAIEAKLDGVHFDEIPEDFNQIKQKFSNQYIGLTVSNDLEKIRWADQQQLAYISFCSVFPSSSVDTCEIVKPENIKAARQITDLNIFLSGGMSPENTKNIEALDFDGVAIISGILDADDPARAVAAYIKAIEKQKA